MRPNIIRAYTLGILTGSFITGSVVLFSTTAKADGYLDDTETDYVLTYGHDAICPVIDQYHSAAGVVGVARAIVSDGFTPDSAVDIINASVQEFCPRNWPLLVSIGNAARSTGGATA